MEFYMVLPFVVGRIVDENGRVLLGRQPNLPHKPYPGLWDMPGGKLDPGDDSIEACIRREIKEETGLEVVQCAIRGTFHHAGDRIRPDCRSAIPGLGICFDLRVSGDLVPNEMEDMHWVKPDELRELVKNPGLTPWAEYFLKDLL